MEFANTSDCLIAEKTITVNLEGEVKLIEGEEVFWSSSEGIGILSDENVLYMIASPTIDSNIRDMVLEDRSEFLGLPAVTPTPTPEEPEVIEHDLGVVHYTQAPKTWTIDVPQNFNKVEVGVLRQG